MLTAAAPKLCFMTALGSFPDKSMLHSSGSAVVLLQVIHELRLDTEPLVLSPRTVADALQDILRVRCSFCHCQRQQHWHDCMHNTYEISAIPLLQLLCLLTESQRNQGVLTLDHAVVQKALHSKDAVNDCCNCHVSIVASAEFSLSKVLSVTVHCPSTVSPNEHGPQFRLAAKVDTELLQPIENLQYRSYWPKKMLQ